MTLGLRWQKNRIARRSVFYPTENTEILLALAAKAQLNREILSTKMETSWVYTGE